MPEWMDEAKGYKDHTHRATICNQYCGRYIPILIGRSGSSSSGCSHHISSSDLSVKEHAMKNQISGRTHIKVADYLGKEAQEPHAEVQLIKIGKREKNRVVWSSEVEDAKELVHQAFLDNLYKR
jgi:hypothetical protein